MLLLALAVFADPTVTVTFTSTPLPVALKQLSKGVGKPLEASMALHDEVLMVRLKDAPREEVLKRVADLYAAEWAPQPDGTLILRPDTVKQRAAQAKRGEKAAATLRGSLAYVAKRLREQPAKFGPAEAASLRKRRAEEEQARKKAEENRNLDVLFRPSNADEESPAWRALARLLPTIGEQALLAIPARHREVWAERNTRLQHPFPIASQAVLQRYREELAALKPEVDIVRVKVVLQRWEMGEAHNSYIAAYGPQGDLVDHAFIRLNNDSERLKIPFSQRFAIPPAGEEKPLAISAEAMEHSLLLTRRAEVKKDRERLLAKWTPILTQPEKREPTSWLPSEAFVAAAEALSVNLIGTAQETSGLAYERMRTETPTQFLTRMKSGLSLEKGWLTVENVEADRRVSRARAGALLRDAVKRGGLSVDAAATFAGATPGIWPFTNWVGDSLGVFFPAGGPRSVLATTGDDTLLRFWDGLGTEGRRVLRNGQTLDLNRLPRPASEHLLFMLLHEERLKEGEPTELFADGVSGSLRMETIETPIFTSWQASEGELTDVVPYDAAGYGAALAKGSSWREIPAAAFQSRDRFRMGLQRTYRLTFQMGGTTLTEELPEIFFDPAAPVLTKLPEAIQHEVEAGRQKALAEPAKPAPGGGGAPPPN